MKTESKETLFLICVFFTLIALLILGINLLI